MADEGVAYEPISVREVLTELKDTAELLIDLSYSAVLLDSEAIAGVVLDLEDELDVLGMQARMSLLVAARNPEDARQLAPVLGVVGATETIANAAGDIASVVLEEVGLPPGMRGSLPEAVESIVRAEIAPGAALVGPTLGERNLETDAGVRVIALERDGSWHLDPGAETRLRPGDAVLFRGPEDGLDAVYPEATGEAYAPPVVDDQTTEDLQRAMDTLVLMKNVSELAVDLAYGAVLFDDEEVAREVLELEAEVDALQSRLVAWTLRAAARVENPIELRGLVQIANSSEAISDAALQISEGVLRGIDAHPVVAAAVEDSDEVIARVVVGPDSALDGTTLGDREVKTETGMRVIAVRTAGARGTDDEPDWVVSPDADTPLVAGDVLLAKGTRSGADRLRDLAGQTD
ncbi:potassium channel family protein [Halococcoides cellulosivorans]|uniref:Potassium channel protein n=1 Tax=Halococcoides cellulosivorans TaxID=1679096 RepID=A0A2R4WXJ4_9EURY|nr:TrkA C-terminal domain-containing protein [Halococcoides cellulosivorans]AWB26231.1 potassium channel protein [Halococcoides cellulosivorans]